MDKNSLDRYITGNWGEDSVPDDSDDDSKDICDHCLDVADVLEMVERNGITYFMCPDCVKEFEGEVQ